jgi:hypothetical protein
MIGIATVQARLAGHALVHTGPIRIETAFLDPDGASIEQRVTVLDDRVDVYRTDDIHRLRDMSQLVAFSDRQTLEDLLAA